MYERTLDGKVLEFGHEGILYEKSFVFYDKGTHSLWIHVTAEAVKGPLKGKRLQYFPSVLTTWEHWKARYPDTQVLGGSRREGFMGTFSGLDEAEADKYGLAVFYRGIAQMYAYPVLAREFVIEHEINGTAVLVAFSQKAGIARAFLREVDGEMLSFTRVDGDEGEMLLKDLMTDSVWDPVSGAAIEGAFEGEALSPLVSFPILVDRFPAFYPDSEIIEEVPSGSAAE